MRKGKSGSREISCVRYRLWKPKSPMNIHPQEEKAFTWSQTLKRPENNCELEVLICYELQMKANTSMLHCQGTQPCWSKANS